MNLEQGDYKYGVIEFNPDNMWGAKSFDDMENDFAYWINDARLKQTEKEKFNALNMVMGMLGCGNLITKEAFIKILNFVEIDYEVFEKYILDLRKHNCGWNTFWFDTLKIEDRLIASIIMKKLDKEYNKKVFRKMRSKE